MKKKVAIWMFGGIGTGNFSQGQPVLEKLIHELSLEFEIIVYSRSLINEDYVSKDFKIKCASKNINNPTLRWLLLFKYFLRDHFQKKFSLVCAFWGFPGGFLATCIAKILLLPSVVNLQGGDSIGIPSLKYGVMFRPGHKRLALWTYRNATLLTALTNFQKARVVEYGVSRPIRVIPFGVDSSVFKYFPKTKSRDEPYHFIHVSNYNPIKDPETLLKAFSLICKKKTCVLRIVGDGYEQPLNNQFCSHLGIEGKVEFYGPEVYDGMAEHYAWADVMLHTSLYEGQGIVIAEAAMCGVLIAGTSVGLISDLGEAASVAVSIGDFQLLAEKVLDVIDHPAVWEEKRRLALAWAKQNDFLWTVNQHKRIFHELGQSKLE